MSAMRPEELTDRLRRAWGRFSLRRHWPWVLVVLGLALRATGRGGCGGALLWVGALVLLGRGLRWVWDRLLFRVSRRLWVILVLMSVLPVLGLGISLLGFAWLGLGAQVSRATQQTLAGWEEALKAANAAPTEAAALQMLQTYGGGWIEHTQSLPPDVPKDFLGMVWAPGRGPDAGRLDTYLRAVKPEPGGYRLLSLNLGMLGDRMQALAGGQVRYRLAPRGTANRKEGPITVRASKEEDDLQDPDALVLAGAKEAIGVWERGRALSGGGLNRPFDLPPLAFGLLEWKTGRPLVLSATPQTNLVALFAGYRSADRQAMSLGAVKAMIIVGLVLVALFLGQAFATLLGLRLAWALGRAVNALHRGVQRLSLGDFTARIAPRGKDQVAHLTRAFNEMAERLQRADEERHERLRMEEELRVAREVQMRLLPDLDALRLPSVRATILPAREVAGDYYDLFPLPEGGLAFLIADVSGKGTSAAFYAAETKGVLSALDKAALDPLEVASRLNAIWCEGHGRRLFLTLAYGVFEPRTGRFAFVRAGHPPAFLRRADGRVERLCPRGLGIGLSATRFRSATEVCEGTLEPGDRLVFFTDGLSEAQDPSGAFYGEARLAAVLAGPCEDAQAAILADVTSFLQGAGLGDDLTLLVLSR